MYVDTRSLSKPEVVLGSSLIGATTFPSVLALAQKFVFKPLRVTAGRGIVSSVCGGLSVCVAGSAVSLAVVKSCSLLNNEETSTKLLQFSTPELIASTISSVVVFRALGGRFYSVLPSHLMYPGAFAREWLPAIRGVQGASAAERELIQTLGKKHGCHTCGRKRVSLFVCDHQPPSKIVNNTTNNHSSSKLANHNSHTTNEITSKGTNNNISREGPSTNVSSSTTRSTAPNGSIAQRFYPQCQPCSSSQGGILSLNVPPSGSAVRTHVTRLRLHHLFLPLPLVLLYFKSRCNDDIIVKSDQSNTRIVSCPENTIVQDDATQSLEKAGTTQSASKGTLHTLISESNISELVDDFPLLIVWKKMVAFLDSFKNAGDAFHITLWAFAVIAALGTI